MCKRVVGLLVFDVISDSVRSIGTWKGRVKSNDLTTMTI